MVFGSLHGIGKIEKKKKIFFNVNYNSKKKKTESFLLFVKHQFILKKFFFINFSLYEGNNK
jgi:hypothetical protein